LRSEARRLARIASATTFRLALLFGLLPALGVLALGGLIYVMTARELTARSDQILRQEEQVLLSVSPARLPVEVRDDVARNVHGLNYFALVSASGELISGNIDPIPALRPGPAIDIERSAHHGPMRVMAVTAQTEEILVLGRDISEIRYLLRRMAAIILIGSGGVIAVVLAVGTVLSRGPLRRIHELQIASRQIATGQFDVRIPTTGRMDEFDQIATMINAMVDDIGRIIVQAKTITDSIAHDLRTPLTRLRNRLDDARLAGSELRSGDSIDDLIGDLDVVLERFAALLRIAELEASERRAGFGPVDVTSLLETVGELYAPLAEDAGIRLDLTIEPGMQVHGDRNLLIEAIGNLVDNAIKFAAGRVRIRAYREDELDVILVADDGPGIDADERGAVLQRFYRAGDGAQKPGFGLGLSIVSAILHIHHFDLALRDAGPGLAAQIRARK